MFATTADSALRKILPYLKPDETALTGGVAIHYWLEQAGRPSRRTTIADIDVVASALTSIEHGVTDCFLVSHYHEPQPDRPKFMIQLVDPDSRVRVDCFPDLVGSIVNARWVEIGGARLALLPPDAILDHKLLTLARASADRPVDGKHYQDAQDLAALCGRTIASIDPAVLAQDQYQTDARLMCARCEASRHPAFPLAPKQRILDILGYV